MRLIIKKSVYGVFCIAVLPIALVYLLLGVILPKDSLVAGYSQLLSLFPGITGSYIRKTGLRVALARCHWECQIGFGVLFSQQDTEIHSGVYIGPQSNIGKCSIGKNCLIGSGVHIMSGRKQHNFTDTSMPIKDQGGVFEKVTIGENCWVGNAALIMASIGNNCIVAAGSVVTKPIPDGAIVAGNPAVVVKQRDVPCD
ncbi:acyltransferase [Teredinibacter purpureus]|uniref:acyltransferase n=1 Tax=Teredinibacter purpureus TaxID=2731756 RepID=UPI0005F8603B|nr:acyltransferase [Teredinibacter purpureus]